MLSRIRKHLSFANVMACAAVFIALGGSAYAVGKNSVGTKQLKNNAVTSNKIKKNAVVTSKIRKDAIVGAKIRPGAVTTNKIGDGAVTTNKIGDGAVNGAKIDESTLGTVPSAANLVGQENFFVKLNGGENQVIAKYGVVALRAFCKENDGGSDRIEIYAETTQDGAILEADESKNGGPDPADFLNTNTPIADREFEEESINPTGRTYVDADIDSGFVLGPDGKAILANSEAIILGLNYLGSRCITGGVVNYIDAP
jgi:hypothetical protein